MTRRALPGDKLDSTVSYDDWNRMQNLIEKGGDILESVAENFGLVSRDRVNDAGGNAIWCHNDTGEKVFPGQIVYYEGRIWGAVNINAPDLHGNIDPAFGNGWGDPAYDDRAQRAPSPTTTQIQTKDQFPFESQILKLVDRTTIDTGNWQLNYPYWGVAMDVMDDDECGWVQVAGVAKCWCTCTFPTSNVYENFPEVFNQWNIARMAPSMNPNVFNQDGDTGITDDRNTSSGLPWKHGEYLVSSAWGARVIWQNPTYNATNLVLPSIVNLSDRGGPWHWQGKAHADHNENTYQEYTLTGPFVSGPSDMRIPNVYYPDNIGKPKGEINPADPIKAGTEVTITYDPLTDMHVITGAQCSEET